MRGLPCLGRHFLQQTSPEEMQKMRALIALRHSPLVLPVFRANMYVNLFSAKKVFRFLAPGRT